MRLKDIEQIILSKDIAAAKYAIITIKKRFKDWSKIIDEYIELKPKQKKEFKKDPLNSAIIDEYEEISPLISQLEELGQHDLRERRF